ncbi:MAG TPA: DUF1634 domain-containing protein [Symbiobacteriaceae bacterium]|nr:DUF1634 domain-containing protein [Symbiobacteriaceae bacterium]
MEMMEGKQSRVESIELILARLLRIGSMMAAGLMGVGIVMLALGLASGSLVVTAGLVVLVSTPILRVSVAMIVFLRERDYLFALFCLVVIGALFVGMLIGKAE